MPNNIPRAACAGALDCATTAELIDALRRRSLGCMIVCVRVEEGGDAWHYALKGSSLLLGAMSAALSLKTSHKISEHRAAGGDEFAGAVTD